MSTFDVTAENFETEVVESDVPVILDLWAPWCGPCRALDPLLKKLAGEYEGKVKVGKLNVDEQPELAQAFRVQSIPMIVALKGRDVQEVMVGAQGEAPLRKMFDKLTGA
ncbi:MAG: thioredoxin [Bradymonadaceae bacterium]|nr:thioredoxin [Lujinxingiaceae bacterium]